MRLYAHACGRARTLHLSTVSKGMDLKGVEAKRAVQLLSPPDTTEKKKVNLWKNLLAATSSLTTSAAHTTITSGDYHLHHPCSVFFSLMPPPTRTCRWTSLENFKTDFKKVNKYFCERSGQKKKCASVAKGLTIELVNN